MGVAPALIVLHTEVGTEAAAQARFENANDAYHASAHYSVNLDGSIVQFVDEKDASYHAGNFAANMDSIGIEHEDNGDYNGPRTPQLYSASARLVKDIAGRYGIPLQRITKADYQAGHSGIIPHGEIADAATGCPDALDVDRIIRIAAGQEADPMSGPVPPDVELGPFDPPVTGRVWRDAQAYDYKTLAVAPGTYHVDDGWTYNRARRVSGVWYTGDSSGPWALKDADIDTGGSDPQQEWDKQWDKRRVTPTPAPAPAPIPTPTPAPAPAPTPAPTTQPIGVSRAEYQQVLDRLQQLEAGLVAAQSGVSDFRNFYAKLRQALS